MRTRRAETAQDARGGAGRPKGAAGAAIAPPGAASAMDGAEFKAHRDRLGMTQVALAAALGVHPISVARYEGGTRQVSGPVANLLRSLRRGRKLRPARVAVAALLAMLAVGGPAAAGQVAVAVTDAAAPSPWPPCGGTTLHLSDPYSLPYWQTLDQWTVYLVSDVADPTASTYQGLGLPPNQPPAARVGPGPQDIAPVVQVKVRPEWCAGGCIYWVKVWPNDGGTCADSHAGFPFDHSGGQ